MALFGMASSLLSLTLPFGALLPTAMGVSQFCRVGRQLFVEGLEGLLFILRSTMSQEGLVQFST